MKFSAIPEKRVFLSIISEYDLNRSICEMADNAIDQWMKNGKVSKLKIDIAFDQIQKTITVEDNSGGVEEINLDHLVSPGKTSNEITEDVIGYFGVGSKRSMIALAEDITIHTRFKNNKTFCLHIDEYWITEDLSWDIEYVESKKSLKTGTTLIELSKLRISIEQNEIDSLKRHLSEVYGRFIELGIEIRVDNSKLSAIKFDSEWCFPPSYLPKQLNWKVDLGERLVDVSITTGLMNHSGDSDDSYGVFLYCNDRLITRGLNDYSVGFVSGLIGIPHYNISLVRTIIDIKGQSRDMPWDSSKSGIDQKHRVFKAIQQRIIDITKSYAQISRSLQGKWDEELFPHKRGKVQNEQLDNIGNIPKNYLPQAPASKERWHQKVQKLNASLLKQKPWAGGLQDSIIAADMIFKSSLVQKNRVCLVIIDSTLEIAYKEYILKEQGMGSKTFKNISENRADVQKEVLKTISISNVDLKKLNHYYKLRCDLIHQKSTPTIDDSEIEDYRQIVCDLLLKMFGMSLS